MENFIRELFFLVLEKKMNLNAVREYARRGCPTSLRGKLWSTMLEFELFQLGINQEDFIFDLILLSISACCVFQLSQTKCY